MFFFFAMVSKNILTPISGMAVGGLFELLLPFVFSDGAFGVLVFDDTRGRGGLETGCHNGSGKIIGTYFV